MTMKAKLGHVQSEITRTKISNGKKGKVLSTESKIKIATKLKGRKVTEETKNKLRIAMLNKKPNEETREKMRVSHSKPVLVFNINNNTKCIYPSIKQAAAEFNTTSTKIRKHIQDKTILFDLYDIT